MTEVVRLETELVESLQALLLQVASVTGKLVLALDEASSPEPDTWDMALDGLIIGLRDLELAGQWAKTLGERLP